MRADRPRLARVPAVGRRVRGDGFAVPPPSDVGSAGGRGLPAGLCRARRRAAGGQRRGRLASRRRPAPAGLRGVPPDVRQRGGDPRLPPRDRRPRERRKPAAAAGPLPPPAARQQPRIYGRGDGGVRRPRGRDRRSADRVAARPRRGPAGRRRGADRRGRRGPHRGRGGRSRRRRRRRIDRRGPRRRDAGSRRRTRSAVAPRSGAAVSGRDAARGAGRVEAGLRAVGTGRRPGRVRLLGGAGHAGRGAGRRRRDEPDPRGLAGGGAGRGADGLRASAPPPRRRARGTRRGPAAASRARRRGPDALGDRHDRRRAAEPDRQRRPPRGSVRRRGRRGHAAGGDHRVAVRPRRRGGLRGDRGLRPVLPAVGGVRGVGDGQPPARAAVRGRRASGRRPADCRASPPSWTPRTCCPRTGGCCAITGRSPPTSPPLRAWRSFCGRRRAPGSPSPSTAFDT